MLLTCLSDTHTFHDQVSLPDADVLVHAGDLSLSGKVREVQTALDWLNKQPHKRIVLIAGNHDFAFERRPSELDLGRIDYLENSEVTIDGVKFYGSPVQPWFLDWAFNVQRGNQIKRYWDMIPSNTDVLITHGPPLGILDQAEPHKGTEHLGCEDLFNQLKITRPKIHVFGHIHGGYGIKWEADDTRCYNASVVNESYKVVNKPWVVEL